MELKEAVTFWEKLSFNEISEDRPIVIDAESVPGWIIALRRPQGRAPYVEIWWEGDFITETQAHKAAKAKLNP